ncbi:hypothetical protein [Haemophilus parahaemolyticus]|uniref:hypothetical protein n=1 Tax=Haemophilus parahaemolyticus TaxID=735 RepID=UPI002889AD0A|nr:hypothetical protein [Haemophilus parahaemolyticus]
MAGFIINRIVPNTHLSHQGYRGNAPTGNAKPHFKMHKTAGEAKKAQRIANRRKSMGGKGG